MRAKLIKASICPCGFSTLTDDIDLGTVCDVDFDTIAKGTYVCGGCNTEQKVTAVYVATRGDSDGGFMPLGLFEPLPAEESTTAEAFPA